MPELYERSFSKRAYLAEFQRFLATVLAGIWPNTGSTFLVVMQKQA
jgi:hypothetical protein